MELLGKKEQLTTIVQLLYEGHSYLSDAPYPKKNLLHPRMATAHCQTLASHPVTGKKLHPTGESREVVIRATSRRT
jgi:hypothetical protein